MDFQIIILLISFIVSVILGIFIIPILKKLKVGQIERTDGPESHLSKQGTPTMGGIILMLAIVISITCVFIYLSGTNPDLATKILPILIISLGFGAIGLIDDSRKLLKKNTDGLKPAYKMLGLLIISIFFILYMILFIKVEPNTYIPIIKTYIYLGMPLYVIFNIFVILGATNAVNLTDGVDGLATSVSTIIITCLTVIGIIKDIQEIAIFGSIVTGACLGFLIFNMNPAKVFMGDTGSLFLGGVIAGMAIYLRMPLILVVISIIPVIEAVSVILQVLYFKKTGKRIFKMAPIHHHFELSGWNENKVVSIFSVITLIFCIIGLKII